MKLLVSVEHTKSKYEILSGKVTEILTDLESSQKGFMEFIYSPFIAMKQTLFDLIPVFIEDYKFQEGIPEPTITPDSPFVEKQTLISNALKQLRANYETLKKNNDLIEIFAGDLAKDFDFTKNNMEKLEIETRKLADKQKNMEKKSIEIRDEITAALLDSEYSQQKITKLSSGAKTIEDQRAEIEKIMLYVKERLNAWKKHAKLLPAKCEKIANHVKGITQAIGILKKEAEKIAKLIDAISKSLSPNKAKENLENSPLQEMGKIEEVVKTEGEIIENKGEDKKNAEAKEEDKRDTEVKEEDKKDIKIKENENIKTPEKKEANDPSVVEIVAEVKPISDPSHVHTFEDLREKKENNTDNLASKDAEHHVQGLLEEALIVGIDEHKETKILENVQQEIKKENVIKQESKIEETLEIEHEEAKSSELNLNESKNTKENANKIELTEEKVDEAKIEVSQDENPHCLQKELEEHFDLCDDS